MKPKNKQPNAVISAVKISFILFVCYSACILVFYHGANPIAVIRETAGEVTTHVYSFDKKYKCSYIYSLDKEYKYFYIEDLSDKSKKPYIIDYNYFSGVGYSTYVYFGKNNYDIFVGSNDFGHHYYKYENGEWVDDYYVMIKLSNDKLTAQLEYYNEDEEIELTEDYDINNVPDMIKINWLKRYK